MGSHVDLRYPNPVGPVGMNRGQQVLLTESAYGDLADILTTNDIYIGPHDTYTVVLLGHAQPEIVTLLNNRVGSLLRVSIAELTLTDAE